MPLPAEEADRSPGLPATRADQLILAYVAAMAVLWVPGLHLGLLTPRVAVLLVGIGPGLIVVGSLVRRHDVGGAWLAGFVAWALVAALASPSPRLAVVGTYGSDIGWLYLLGYASAWGLGRRLTADGRRLLPVVLLVGLGANALFALLEALFEPAGMLAPSEGRVLGLMSNTLFLAGTLAGGLALIGSLVGANVRRRVPIALVAVPFTAALNLTGSRAALLGGVVLGIAGAALGRTARSDGLAGAARAGLIMAAAIVVGFLASLPLVSDAAGTSRIGEVSTASGYGSRITMWEAGVRALGERPLTGWGPGRFREATSTRTTADFAAAEAADRLFYDAHNVVVEQAVTTGVVGLVLFVGFAVTVFRRARGPLAWFAGGVAVTWLLNPLSVCTAPVVLVALGAAWNQDPPRGERPSPKRVAVARGVGAALALVGLVVGTAFAWTDVLVERGSADADVATVEAAARLRPSDPVLQGLLADARVQRALEDPTAANKAAAVAAAERTVRLDPTRPTWWVRRGTARGAFGRGTQDERVEAAKADYERALALSPWSLEAMSALRDVAAYQGDDAAVARWTERICRITDCSGP